MSTQIPPEVDVLVVGYGPVGATIACLLGGYGVRALVIDRERDIYMAPRAIALDNEALRILHQLVGLADDAFGKVVIPQVRMHSPYVGLFGRMNTAITIDCQPALVTFYQPELERALRKRAESYPDITLAVGVEFVEFTEQSGEIQATVKSSDGAQHSVKAKFLIGADGANSRVRKGIGQEFTGTTYGQDWLIVDAMGVADNIDHVEFICNPRRPTPHMVAPGGRTRWEFMLAPGETREEMEREESIQRLLAPWANASELKIERKAVYRFSERSCERYSKGRVFLAGDAAHVTPPFAGQGLVSGLRDAANLSWKLAWVIRGQAHPQILESYDPERRPHAIAMIGLAKQMGSMIMPTNAFKAILIQGMMKTLRMIPPVRTFLEAFGQKPKNQFKTGLFARGRSRLPRGGVIPQFRIGSPSGAVAPSDEILGASLAIIGLGANVESHISPALKGEWTQCGGKFFHFAFPKSGETALHEYSVLDPEAIPLKAREAWCAVIRPDRTILHDGPASDAERIVAESIRMLKGSV